LTNEKLNTLALKAKSGCYESFEAIVRHYLPVIQKISRRYRIYLDDESAFEWSCYLRLKNAIAQYNPDKCKSFGKFVSLKLRSARIAYYSRFRNKEHPNFEYFDEFFDKDQEKETFKDSLVDVLADVESSIVAKEMIALLAEGDPKREAILIAWCDGCYNDSKLSELLAQLFGGKAESHRKAITRFRKHCQAVLAKPA
jgi:hypothetical protein